MHLRIAYLLTLQLILVIAPAFSQENRYAFDWVINTPVSIDNDTLNNPWGGGLNYPNFSEVDLNLDGQMDLLAFDRSGYRIIPLVSTNINGSQVYRYEPKYIEAFPVSREVGSFLLMRDFNCDGKNDIFYSAGNFLQVFENVSSNGELKFNAFDNGQLIKTTYLGGTRTDLYLPRTDLPAINDVDGDGDLDILTFGNGGVTVEWHENINNGCGLQFRQATTCWGGFLERGIYRTVELNACGGGNKKSAERLMHAGSGMLAQDLNGDNIADLLLTSVSFNNLSLLINNDADTANIVSQDTLYPPSKPLDLYIFPAPYYADANHDQTPDLLISSYNNATSGSPDVSSNHNGIWRYENTGQANNPNFTFAEDNFLQGEMIDFGAAATPRLADLNGDSLTDLVVAIGDRYQGPGNASSQFYFFENTGTATEPAFTLRDTNFADILNENLGTQLVPAFGDLDNDGDKDMIVGTVSGYFHEFENVGTSQNPDFTLKQLILTNTTVRANAAPYLYDIEQDGDLDLFVGSQSGKVWLFENEGSSSQADFKQKSDFFGAINVSVNQLSGNAKPALFRDSGQTVLMTGSTNGGVFQFDGADTVAQLPSNLNGGIGNQEGVTANFEETPFGISKRTGRNQMLWRASELKQAGLTAGFIKSVSFFVSDPGGVRIDNGFTLKLKNTTLNNLNTFEENFPQPYPWDNRSSSFGPGWNNIAFTAPFYWDGQSNLLLEICFRGNLPATDIKLATSDAGFMASAFGDITGFNTIQANGCAMPYKTSTADRPDIQFDVTPAVGQVSEAEKTDLFTGWRTSPDFADLNGDGYMDAVIGNLSGGLSLFFGREYDLSKEEIRSKPGATEVSIFPNPNQGSFTVQQNLEQGSPYQNYQLFNLSGKLLQSGSLTGNGTEIRLKQAPAGIYIIVISDDQRRTSRKLVVH